LNVALMITTAMCCYTDGIVVKADSRQLKYNIRDGQVQTEEFLEGRRNVIERDSHVITGSALIGRTEDTILG